MWIKIFYLLGLSPVACWRLQPSAKRGLFSRARVFRETCSERSSAGYTAVLIVPTGIGASIGGYAGDALPVAQVLGSVVDTLVTHPNVMNGAALYWPTDNILYVEGFALDLFCRGKLGLQPISRGSNRIGLVLDRAMTEEEKMRHLQVANAARATLGFQVTHVVETDTDVGVNIKMSPAGASWGTLEHPDTLVRAATTLVIEHGCEAVAVVAKFPEDEDEAMLDAYRHGDGVDAIGGAEALISHLITHAVGVPCAHAPALPPLPVDKDVSPRACAEELAYTFLPCVLANLRNAPKLISPAADTADHTLGVWESNVDAIIVPATACGGSSVLSLCRRRILVIVVEENETEMRATPEALHIDKTNAEVVRVCSYLEAAGVLAAHKAGILPSTLTRASTMLTTTPP